MLLFYVISCLVYQKQEHYQSVNSLDPYQDGQSVRPDLGPNCKQRLSADDKSLLAMEELNYLIHI